MAKKPVLFNVVGVYCWHQYDSNPALMEIWARGGTATDKWALVTKIRLAMVDMWQYFRIQELAVQRVRELKIRVMENFGDTKTYINKIGLFYTANPVSKQSTRKQASAQESEQVSPMHMLNNPTSSTKQPPPMRQKTHSEHHHYNPSTLHLQKQLKKAHEAIACLTEQQQTMKKTILQQEKVIIRIQETLKSVLLNMTKMQQIQEMEISGGKGPSRSRYNGDEVVEYDEHWIDENRSRNPKKKQASRNEIQNLKSMLNSFQKQSQPLAHKKPLPPSSNPKKYLTHKADPEAQHQNTRTDVIKTNSEENMSEYGHPHYRTSQVEYQYDIGGKGSKYDSLAKENHKEKSMSKGDRGQMLERLVRLLELKEKKKLELKKSGAKNSRAQKLSLHAQFDQEGYESNSDNYNDE